MVNINNKPWDKLRFRDIEKFLSESGDENFFFEFKSDDEEPKKLIKEISAFANTYGGYILLGVNDDKTIGGCKKWTEQRIHITIHDSITPIPNFDVKKFTSKGKHIFVIKIEEGATPPYITNRGDIYERVSSGSFPIKESIKLDQLYQKRKDELIRRKNIIELPSLEIGSNFPQNVFAYLDFGFFMASSDKSVLWKKYQTADLEKIAEYIRTINKNFSISRVGASYLFSVGEFMAKDQDGNSCPMNAGIHDFMEVFPDGSARGRILLNADPNSCQVDISIFIYCLGLVYQKIYSMIFQEALPKEFVYTYKYEKLTVLKQFIPVYDMLARSNPGKQTLEGYLNKHEQKYGNNLIIESSRYPKNDYLLIDRRYFDEMKVKCNATELYGKLFHSKFFNLGYIDSPFTMELLKEEN